MWRRFFAADAAAKSKKTSEQSEPCSDAVVEIRGLEPLTSALRTQRSTN